MYAVAQVKGSSKAMADTIRCISYNHLTIRVNAVNYDHKIVPGGFNEQRSYEELRDIFQKIISKYRGIFMQCF
jgi:hypothetical protein